MLGTELGPAFWALYQDPTQSLDNIREWADKPEIKEFTEDTKINFTVVIAGMTQRDADHQDKVLDMILETTRGWKSKKWSEPEMEQFTMLYMLRLGKKNLNFAYNGGWVGAFMQSGPPDFVNKYWKLAEDVLEPYQKKGLLVECGKDSMMGCVGSINGGGACGLEQFGFYDVSDKISTGACIEWMDECLKESAKHGLPPGKEGVYRQVGKTQEELNKDYAKNPAPFIWQAKIKAALDPNNLGDQMYLHFDPLPK